MLNLSNFCYLFISVNLVEVREPLILVFSVVMQRYSWRMICPLWTTFLFITSSYRLLIILSCIVFRNCRKCNGWWLFKAIWNYIRNSVLRTFWLVLSFWILKAGYTDDDSARFEFESEPITINWFLKQPTNLLHFV